MSLLLTVEHSVPLSFLRQEIMEEYPEAKVVLTIRDVDSWWKSLIGSVHNKAPGFQQWGKHKGGGQRMCLAPQIQRPLEH